jgi:hypothetical protein
MFGGDSSGADRERDGYDYAEKNYSTLVDGLGKDEAFELVTHSEGGAYGAGIARYLMLKGHTVKTIVHLSTDEADEFDTPFGPDTYQLSYSGDWVTGNKEIDNVSVFAIVDKFKSKSDKFQYAHGSTKSSSVFKELKALLKAIKDHKGIAGFRAYETKNGVKFEVIRDYTEEEEEQK